MKRNEGQPARFESPIEGLSQDDFEFSVDFITAVEFGHRNWYASGTEYKERGMTLNDLFENDGGRLSEIILRLGLNYETFRDICWNAVVAKHEKISKAFSNKRTRKETK